ncbi:MAG: M24 family metallopeptidase [Holosporales bacterium]|jgi:Xaa-Pro aminopeptidase|nr:M24 family metallopeptidase [Holosporales bacterium]
MNNILEEIRSFLSDKEAILTPIKCSFDNYENKISSLELLSGFTGSSGIAIVSKTNAILCVDGRYTTQARKQTDQKIWKIEQSPQYSVENMIRDVMSAGDTLVVSLLAHSYKSYLKILEITKSIDVNVRSIIEHPITRYKENGYNENRIVVMDDWHEMDTSDGAILTASKDTISWIFGIRKEKLGNDKSPLVNAIALISETGKPVIFSDLPIANNNNNKFDYHPFDSFEQVMLEFKNYTIKANYSQIPAFFLVNLLKSGFNIVSDQKTHRLYTKTDSEIEAEKYGAFETSISFIKLLAHVDYLMKTGHKISEKEAVAMFKNPKAIDFSFKPICASGKNTALVHYTDGDTSNYIIENEALFLFDAGFHFDNSTTDMTRVLYFGDNCPQEFKNVYTTVLKSVIFYSMSIFPENTECSSLDTISRYYMWKHNMDYDFGTGHGIGNYRWVHESPRIAKESKDQMKCGMVTSIEPGYYTENYGIRLENMLLTVHAPNGMLQFEVLTYVPFCNNLIDKSLLGLDEIEWLNNYNSEILQKFVPIFQDDDISMAWVKENTSAL